MTASLAHSAWPSIGDSPLVLVPTGSTEQHGPHLPLDTDAVIATAVSVAVAERLREQGQNTIVAPTVPYGASGEHQSFPGTVSIGHEALGVLLVELVRSLSTWAGRIVLVNGHGGNLPTLISAVGQLIEERHTVAWVPCDSPGGDAHAGRTETSLMLHLAPRSVDLGAAVVGNAAPMAELMPELSVRGVRAVSPSGILGDPTGASAAEGSTLLDAMVVGVYARIALAEVDGRGCLRHPGRPS